ncbi:hypothetical protein JCM10207_008565, partial [Rhodosporidiobolus poonsookiae]
GFTFSGEGESMIHHAAGSLSRLHMTDDRDEDHGDAGRSASRKSSSSGASTSSRRMQQDPQDDEWEDER